MKSWTRAILFDVAAVMLSMKVDINHIFNFLQMDLKKINHSASYCCRSVDGYWRNILKQKNVILVYCVTDIRNGNNM